MNHKLSSSICGLLAGVVLASNASAQVTLVSWGGIFQDAQREVFFDPLRSEGLNIHEDSWDGGMGILRSKIMAGDSGWERQPNPEDGRSALLCLSAEGKEMVHRILDDSHERNERMLPGPIHRLGSCQLARTVFWPLPLGHPIQAQLFEDQVKHLVGAAVERCALVAACPDLLAAQERFLD